MNRLAGATSPYLLQHADNPVDWWEWGDEAFAEARRRDVPVLLSVGYAACHWCHVMAHESFEDEATAAYLNEHFVSVKVDREERPDVDAVYMAGDRRDDRPGRLADDVRARPRRRARSSPAPTSPTSRGTGSRRSGRCSQALAEAWTQPAATRCAAVAADVREHLRRGGRARRRRRRSTPTCSTRRCATLGAATSTPTHGGFGGAPEVPAVDGARVPAAARTPAPGRRARRRWSTRTLRGDGARRDLRPARRRLRALLRRPRLGGAALREDALRQRPAARRLRPLVAARRPARRPGRPRDRRLPARASCAPTEGGFASALDADTEGVEGTLLRLDARPSWSRCSARRTARGPPRCSTVTDAGHLRARHLDAAAAAPTPTTPSGGRRSARRLLAARGDAGPAGPRRQGGRRLERPGDRRAGRGRRAARTRRSYVDAARAARRRCWPTCTCDGRPAAPGLPRRRRRRRTPACSRTTAASRTASSRCCGATGDARWLERARTAARRRARRTFARRRRRLLRHRRRRRGAGRAAAGPDRQRQPVGPVGAGARAARLRRAHRLGPAPRRRRGGAGHGRRRSPTQAPRFAGWSLAAAEAALDGPVEVAVVGAGRRPGARRARARVARERAPPGRSWWSADAGREPASRCWPAATLVDGRAAAYVCRDLVCERPGHRRGGPAAGCSHDEGGSEGLVRQLRVQHGLAPVRLLRQGWPAAGRDPGQPGCARPDAARARHRGRPARHRLLRRGVAAVGRRCGLLRPGGARHDGGARLPGDRGPAGRRDGAGDVPRAGGRRPARGAGQPAAARRPARVRRRPLRVRGRGRPGRRTATCSRSPRRTAASRSSAPGRRRPTSR